MSELLNKEASLRPPHLIYVRPVTVAVETVTLTIAEFNRQWITLLVDADSTADGVFFKFGRTAAEVAGIDPTTNSVLGPPLAEVGTECWFCPTGGEVHYNLWEMGLRAPGSTDGLFLSHRTAANAATLRFYASSGRVPE